MPENDGISYNSVWKGFEHAGISAMHLLNTVQNVLWEDFWNLLN